MRVLVTGNLGYVGSVLTPMLAEYGLEVWGLDANAVRERFAPYIERFGIETS